MTEGSSSDISMQPDESQYRSDVDHIKRRSDDVLRRIADFERRHQEEKEERRREEEKERREREIRRRKGKLTPRTYESYREEELDLKAQLSRLKKRNRKLEEQIDTMKKRLEESQSKEMELQAELDFTYQKRLLYDKRSAMLL